MVNKILKYRTDPPSGDWPSKHLFASHRDGGYYKETKEAIVAGSGSWQSSPQFTLCYGDTPNGTNANVKWAINTNHEGTVNYCGHGGPIAWEGWSYYRENFTNSDVNSLTNGDYTPVVFNIGCWMGKFHGTTCLAEAWVRKNGGGAVGALGAVHYTYNGEFDQKLYNTCFGWK